MSLRLLFEDELRGFYKSKVMVCLWIGLPIMALLLNLWAANTQPVFSFSLISALLVSSIGGTLASVMLAVSIINEKNRHVYELFLIRPVKRRNILIAKFLAIYTCIAVAGLLSVTIGLCADYYVKGTVTSEALQETVRSLSVSLAMMAVSSSAGVAIGVASPSVLVGAIFVIYGGNQISALPLLPAILNIDNAAQFTIAAGALITVALLVVAITLFDKKQF